jgi:hypothetical protein
MNERIREIYRRANEQAHQQACEKSKTNRPQNNTVWNEFVPLFAELIVRECAENFTKVWYEQGLDIRGAELDKFMKRFNEHFGVES